MFRACEPANGNAAVNGARDAMLLLVVLPTTVFALLQGAVFWTLSAAFSHAAFTFVLGRLLAEILFSGRGKLPSRALTCRGTAGFFTLADLHGSVFFYTVVFAAIDRALSSRPDKLAWFCLAATLIAQLIVLYRKHVLERVTALRFRGRRSPGDLPGIPVERGPGRPAQDQPGAQRFPGIPRRARPVTPC